MDPATRGLRLFAATFGLAWIAVSMVAGPGPAAWVELSGDVDQAGVYFALFSLAGAVGAPLAGRAMDRWGRRPVLAGAHLLAAAGFATAGLAYRSGSLRAFAAGTVALAAALAAITLTRLAAGEMFPPSERARAVARVQVSATIGAVGGPILLAVAFPALVWMLSPVLFLVAAGLVWAAPEPLAIARAIAPTVAAASAAGPVHRLARLPFATGIVALMCAQGAMVSVMGVTGVALAHAGHGASTTGLVMSLHFLGMFGLSLVVGRFADRVGRRLTILAGLALLAVGGAVAAFVAPPVGLAVGLLLIGLGWSFAYIGGTVLLTDVIPAPRRARMLGLVDFATALAAAAAAFAGGRYYAARGVEGLGLLAVALVAAPIVIALVLRERRVGVYAPDAAAT